MPKLVYGGYNAIIAKMESLNVTHTSKEAWKINSRNVATTLCLSRSFVLNVKMMNDEIVYGSVLIFTILIGFAIRKLSSIRLKQLATASIGWCLVFGLCKADGCHSIAVFLGNLIIIKMTQKHTSLFSFLWCFGYLLFFRCATFFGLPKASPLANAIQLLLTLKLVSVAIEVHDFRIKQKSDKKENIENVKFQLGLVCEPSAFDIFCYLYCYTGLFTGPFFKYRTYFDFLNMKSSVMQKVAWKDEIFSRAQKVMLFAPLYFLAAYFFSIEYPKSSDFYDEPLWYRLFYMIPIFFLGRMRFYTGWLLAECSFVTLTLGAYEENLKSRPGHGPTIDALESADKKYKSSYNFETIRNVDPYGCDFSPTVRLGMRNWNMGVQWWLANYVHKRWPNNLKQLRIPVVMGVSAFWHGIDPGFFGAFLTMPFVMFAEDLLGSLIKKRLPTKLHGSYDWLNWFAKMRSFEYMYMAFALLTWADTYRYWKSIYFCGHLITFFLIAICLICKTVLKKPRIKDSTIDKTAKKEN